MHPEPVGQPVSFSRNPAQLTYWKQLFLELSGRRQSLNPAEELHLHLLTELLCLHQQSVERGRALDRTHMQQAAEILEAIKPGTHASKPIAIPSQSPAPQASGQQDIVARQPAPAPSASRVTRNDAKLRDGIQMAHTWFEKRQNPVPSVNEVTSPRSPRRLLSIPTPTMMISPFMIRPMTQTLDQCTARHRRLTQERGRLPLQKARKSRPQDLPPGAVLQAQGMTPMCRLRKSPLWINMRTSFFDAREDQHEIVHVDSDAEGPSNAESPHAKAGGNINPAVETRQEKLNRLQREMQALIEQEDEEPE
jgi:hypothetical protein